MGHCFDILFYVQIGRESQMMELVRGRGHVDTEVGINLDIIEIE